MKFLSYIGMCLLVATLATAGTYAWKENKNNWGVIAGNGTVGSFSTWRASGTSDFRSDWASVTRFPGKYVVIYPSAVIGWNVGQVPEASAPMKVALNVAGSYLTAQFNPDMWNQYDADDIWNVALDIWCHKNDANGNLITAGQSDEVMFWTKWKGIAPYGVPEYVSGGREYWYKWLTKPVEDRTSAQISAGWSGWSVRTIKEENATGIKDLRQICIDAGVPTTRFVTGVHAGSEVVNGSASLRLNDFKVWWRNGASTSAHTGQ